MSKKKIIYPITNHPINENLSDDLLNFISSIENSKIEQMKSIREKIYNSLSLNELLFLRKFCKKYWYNQLYTALGFDIFYQKNK